MRSTCKHPIRLLPALLVAAGALTACAGADAAESVETPTEASIAGEDAVATAMTADNEPESHFDTEQLALDESSIVHIALEGTTATSESGDVIIDGAAVTITAAGTYSFSGTLSDGEIIVDADDDDVTLILDGVDIANPDGAAIAVTNAGLATVILADGTTNTLTDGAGYSFPDAETDEPNATLFSDADLTIAGSGELHIVANFNDGINTNDGLVISTATVSIVAVDDGIRGKDYVVIDDATVNVDATGDGIKADNDEDSDRGYVLIDGGSVTLVAGDDGIQAATNVTVIDGTITIAAGGDGIHGDRAVNIGGGTITITESFEGIESEIITIDDGVIDITSNDDGLNVASADTETATDPVGDVRGPGRPRGEEVVGDYYIYINGGTTTITVTGELAEQGDGIDANGHVEMSGGLVVISGPTDTRNSAIDYSGGTFTMTGGTLIGTNVSGRNSEGTGPGQPSLYFTTDSTMPAGTVLHVTTSDGENLVTVEPANEYSAVVFSSPDLVAGDAYDVYLGGTVSGGSATGLYTDDAVTDAGELVGTVTADS